MLNSLLNSGISVIYLTSLIILLSFAHSSRVKYIISVVSTVQLNKLYSVCESDIWTLDFQELYLLHWIMGWIVSFQLAFQPGWISLFQPGFCSHWNCNWLFCYQSENLPSWFLLLSGVLVHRPLSCQLYSLSQRTVRTFPTQSGDSVTWEGHWSISLPIFRLFPCTVRNKFHQKLDWLFHHQSKNLPSRFLLLSGVPSRQIIDLKEMGTAMIALIQKTYFQPVRCIIIAPILPSLSMSLRERRACY